MNEKLMEAVVDAIIVLLAGAVPVLLLAIKSFLKLKQQELEEKITILKDEKTKKLARDIWLVVDEHFRLTEKAEKTFEEKADMFDSLLINKIPTLTKEDLDFLRQTIAGEMNKDR